MQSNTIAALAALAGALAALAVYHFAAIAPSMRRLGATVANHDELLGGGAASASSRVSSLEDAARAHEAAAGRVEQRLLELERLARTDIARVGFVRYNAFANTGSELSYAVALLNREGDGIVLSSIFSREDTRTFGKAVQGYRPLQDASKEELSAIAQARDSTA